MPETMSRTRVWLPNEMAMQKIEAPASNGRTLMPKSSSAIMTAMNTIRIAPATRSSGIIVLSREAGVAAASPSRIAAAASLGLCAM